MRKRAALVFTVILFSSVYYFFNLGLSVFSGLLGYIYRTLTIPVVYILFSLWNYRFVGYEPEDYGLGKPYFHLFSFVCGVLSVVFVYSLSYIVKGCWVPKASSLFEYIKVIYKCLITVVATELILSGIVFNSTRILFNKIIAVVFVTALFVFVDGVDFSQPLSVLLPDLSERIVFRLVLCFIMLFSESIWGTVFVRFCLVCFSKLFIYSSVVNSLFFDCIRYCMLLSLLSIFTILLIKKKNEQKLYW